MTVTMTMQEYNQLLRIASKIRQWQGIIMNSDTEFLIYPEEQETVVSRKIFELLEEIRTTNLGGE